MDYTIPIKLEISETIYKLKHKRFSLYKNFIGNFKITYRDTMLIDLVKLKLKLVDLRSIELLHREMTKKFKSDRINFILKNEFLGLIKKSILEIWNIELKYRRLKRNSNNSKSSMKMFLRFIKKLKEKR